jgi:hypothetical protein
MSGWEWVYQATMTREQREQVIEAAQAITRLRAALSEADVRVVSAEHDEAEAARRCSQALHERDRLQADLLAVRRGALDREEAVEEARWFAGLAWEFIVESCMGDEIEADIGEEGSPEREMYLRWAIVRYAAEELAWLRQEKPGAAVETARFPPARVSMTDEEFLRELLADYQGPVSYATARGLASLLRQRAEECDQLQAKLDAERQGTVAREEALEEARRLARLYASKLSSLAHSHGDRKLREDLARDLARWAWLTEEEEPPPPASNGDV